MKIEVWSDYVCPFCYIGKRTLEQALDRCGFTDQAEISFKAYQLDPATPADSTKTIYESLSIKMGQSVDQAKEMTQGVIQHAETVGLEYNFEGMMEANTFAAHRLAKWAETLGKEAEFTENLLHGYFVAGKNVGSQEILLDTAEAMGLPRDEAEQVLNSARFQAEVEQDIAEANQIGVQGVPFFVVNRKYAISGAQPVENFIDALQQIAEEEGIRPARKETSFCTGESCEN